MMYNINIELSNDIESSVQAAVHSGRFASIDDAMAVAVRPLLREPDRGRQMANDTAHPGLGSIGAMRDDADLLDQAI